MCLTKSLLLMVVASYCVPTGPPLNERSLCATNQAWYTAVFQLNELFCKFSPLSGFGLHFFFLSMMFSVAIINNIDLIL